jgi:hypothetical protein
MRSAARLAIAPLNAFMRIALHHLLNASRASHVLNCGEGNTSNAYKTSDLERSSRGSYLRAPDASRPSGSHFHD